MPKRLLLLNKSVESCSRAKESREVERKQAVVEVEFLQHLLQIKILTYIPLLVPMVWILENL